MPRGKRKTPSRSAKKPQMQPVEEEMTNNTNEDDRSANQDKERNIYTAPEEVTQGREKEINNNEQPENSVPGDSGAQAEDTQGDDTETGVNVEGQNSTERKEQFAHNVSYDEWLNQQDLSQQNEGQEDDNTASEKGGDTAAGEASGGEGGEGDKTDSPKFESWTDALEDKLIDKFRDSPHLWNKKSPGFKTRHKLEIAQRAWAIEFGIPEDSIKSRLKMLRDTYRRATKPPESGSAPKQLTDRQKYIVQRFSFLSGHVQPRNKTNSSRTDSDDDQSGVYEVDHSQLCDDSSKGKSSVPSPQKPNVMKTPEKSHSFPSPAKTSTPKTRKQSPKKQTPRANAGKVIPKSPKSTATRVLNMDIGSESSFQGIKQAPFSKKKTAAQTTTSKKRCNDGTPKRPATGCGPEPDVPNYSEVLKELATAVNRTSPKLDTMGHWTEVLADELRQLPPEIQREARHNIDSYVLNLRRTVRSYSMGNQMGNQMGNPMGNQIGNDFSEGYQHPASKRHADTTSASASASASVSAPPTSMSSSSSYSHGIDMPIHNMNPLLPPISPGRATFPPGVGTSAGAAELLQKIMGSGMYHPYQ